MHRLTPRLLLGLAGWTAPHPAQLELQAFLGSSVSAPSPLSIRQRGRPEWKGKRGWLLDFTHHKIYLTNRPPEVQQFRITNGMNMLTVSGDHLSGHSDPRPGARGEPWVPGGYFLSGGNVMASLTRRVPVAAGIFFSVDGRLSATYIRVPVAQGHAGVPITGLHLHLGVGYQAERSAPERRHGAP